jgi:dihydroxyacetone kinase-like predicted kinase
MSLDDVVAQLLCQYVLHDEFNVFPIANGDTGANMKVYPNLPMHNLLLNPSDSFLLAVANIAKSGK